MKTFPDRKINIYTKLAIQIEPHCRKLVISKRKKSAVWSYEDLSNYLQKYFVFRRDFKRIAELIPQKTCKDAVDLFYMIKKPCQLSLIEAAVRDHAGNKIQLINSKVQYLLQNILKVQDDGNLKYWSLNDIAVKLGKYSSDNFSEPH